MPAAPGEEVAAREERARPSGDGPALDIAGESAPRRSSTSSAPLAGLRLGRAVSGHWALDSTRSTVDGVSMRARHAPGLARSVHRRLS